MDENKRAVFLSDETGEQLLHQYRQSRTPEIRNRLIEHYFALVRSAAGRIVARLGGAVRAEELIASGVFGLIDAIEHFDAKQRVKFTTFGSIRVHGAMLDELRAIDPAPRRVRSRARRLDAAARELQSELGRPPADDELAARLELNWEQYCAWMRDARLAGMRPLSALRGSHENADTGAQSLPPDPSSADPAREAQRRMLRDLVTRSLSRAERLAVTLYYYEDLTMREIGSALDLSESRVSQMLTSVRARLRERLGISRPDMPDELAA